MYPVNEREKEEKERKRKRERERERKREGIEEKREREGVDCHPLAPFPLPMSVALSAETFLQLCFDSPKKL